MKKTIGILMALLLLFIYTAPPTALAEDLSAGQQKALKSAGVSVYPGSTYVTGDNIDATLVMWFGTTDPPEQIMDWYKGKLSGWSEIEVKGSRVIYRGPKGMEAKALSSKPYIFARDKDETVEENDAEITIRIPK